MLEETIFKFRTMAPVQMPDLIDNYNLGETITYEDYAILPYELRIPLSLEKVVSILDEADLAILYHIKPDTSTAKTLFGQKCCAYSYPNKEQMFKINCHTFSDGLVHDLKVTIYNSLEDFAVEVRNDLHINEKPGFIFLTRREDGQILNDFSVHR